MIKPCHKCRRHKAPVPIPISTQPIAKREEAPRIEPPSASGDIRREIVGKTIRIRLKKD
jgi:hypothetical protein